MKLTVFLILVAVGGAFASKSYSQTKMLNLNMREASVKEVLQGIEEQSEFYFLFSENLIDVKRKVDVTLKNQKIEEALDLLFEGTDVNYSIRDRIIVLTTPEVAGDDLLTLQQNTVSGIVTDESGQPLPGVTVVVKGTTQGTVTNSDGNYSISNIPENATLVFSFVGMRTQEIDVENRTSISVRMETETIGLEEVVAVGYGTQKKVNLTGAVSVVSAEAFEDKAISTTAEGLQGLIPNLNINFNNGDPTSRSVDYNIRGFESINGGSPYILVDGVPMNIEDINPDDIASISVLKDASASAIYGGKAAFGVILVTTKQAAKGKVIVKYSHESGLSVPILKGYTFANNSYTDTYYQNLMRVNDGQTPIVQRVLDGRKAYNENPESAPEYAIINGDFEYYGNTDWYGLMLRDFAPTFKHNASISGSGNKSNYYISFGNLRKEGIMNYGDELYTRNNVLGKLNVNLADWISIDEKLTVNMIKTKKPHRYPGQGAHWLQMVSREATYRPVKFPENDPDFPELGGLYFENEIGYLTRTHTDEMRQYNTFLTSGVDIKPIKNLLVRGELSVNYFNQVEDNAGVLLDFVKTSGLVEGGAHFDNGLTSPSIANSGSGFSRGYIFNTYAQYELNNLENHYFKVMAGFNQEEHNNSNLDVTGYNLITAEVPAVNASTGDHIGIAHATHSALRGAFYRLNYIYKDKYLLELSGRYDGTSRFPMRDRYGFFPSGSIGWRISEEGFFKDITVLDNLKIRASYGTLGNQDIMYEGQSLLYPYISSLGISTSDYLVLDEANSFPTYTTMPELVSSTLTWETVSSTNIGLDFTLLDQKLDGSFELYTRDTKDMLMRRQYPEIIGGTPPMENGADLRTKGWELSIAWHDRISNDFSYNLRFSLWDYQTEITKYDNPTGSLAADTYHEGMITGEIWGYETYGIFQSQEEIDNAPDQTTLGQNGSDKWYPGDIRYVDKNDDDKIDGGINTLDDHGDLSIIGNSTARYNYSFNIGLNYKNWSMSAFFQGVGKRDYYPLVNGRFFPYRANSSVYQEDIDNNNIWSEDNLDAYWYRPTVYANKNHAPQTRYMQNGAYLRLRSLILKYKLPTRLISNVGLTRAYFYISGQNLWEHSNLLYNRDPEHNTGNNLNSENNRHGEEITISYPLQRTLSLGVNLTF